MLSRGELSGTDLYKQNYLFIKASTTASPIAGKTDPTVANTWQTDTTADFDMVMINYTLLECASQPLITQKVIGLIDVSADVANPSRVDYGILKKKEARIHVSDLTVTPGSAAVVYKFLTSVNRDLSTDLGDTYSINRTDTNYSATGFCGITNWAVGVESNPLLPGEIPAGDTTDDSSRNLLYATDGGLGDCALVPVGDTTMDATTLVTFALIGLGQAPATAAALATGATTASFLRDTIGFDTNEDSDLSSRDATNDQFFWNELETIWLTGLTHLGTGFYSATGTGTGLGVLQGAQKTPTADVIGDSRYKYMLQN